MCRIDREVNRHMVECMTSYCPSCDFYESCRFAPKNDNNESERKGVGNAQVPNNR